MWQKRGWMQIALTNLPIKKLLIESFKPVRWRYYFFAGALAFALSARMLVMM